MSKVTQAIQDREHNGDDSYISIMMEMEDAMKLFVARVDEGSIRSVRTYASFKEILGLD